MIDIERKSLPAQSEPDTATPIDTERAALEARAREMCFGQPVDPTPDDVAWASLVLAGEVELPGHDAEPLEIDPNWLPREGADANWSFLFQSLTWVDALRRMDDSQQTSQIRERYSFFLQDWWDDNRDITKPTTSETVGGDYRWFDMATAWRSLVYVCAISELGAEGWLIDSIRHHGDVLADPDAYAGVGNHALHQDISLAAIGYVLEEPDWIDLAVRRSEQLLAGAIDGQGASLEGSASYQHHNYRWWSDIRDRFKQIGAGGISDWDRLDAMPTTMAHFVAPDGRWALLGDTDPESFGPIGGTPFDFATSQGAVASPPAEEIVRLDSGYVLARNSWDFNGDTMNFVGFRFGPAMDSQVHGHEDLGHLVYYVGPDRVIEDSGLYAYFGGELRQFVVSQAAHNTVHVDGARYYRSADGPLTAYEQGDGWFFANMTTGAIEQAGWSRSVVAHLDSGIVVVDDRISQNLERPVRQTWHLGADMNATVSGSSVAAAAPGGAAIQIIGLEHPADSVVIGTGVRSVESGQLFDVETVAFASVGASRFTTVLAPAGTAAELIWRSGEGFRVLVESPSSAVDIAVGNATNGSGIAVLDLAER